MDNEFIKNLTKIDDEKLISEEVEERIIEAQHEREKDSDETQKKMRERLKELQQKPWSSKSYQEQQEQSVLEGIDRDVFGGLLSFFELKKQFGSVRGLEMMRRLKNSIEKLNKTTTVFSIVMIILTVALVVLTVVLVQ